MFREEQLEQLTTPEIKSNDTVFPGESFFFYWRTSPSLWEAKLREYKGALPIIVPINWSLHSDHVDQFDFGQNKPETDLKRLEEAAKAVGQEIVFAVQTAPAPFLSNGGLPSYLARNLSLDKDGVAIAVLDDNYQVNRIYSFYDPRIFQAYRKYVWNLGQYISQTGISSPVHGIECFRIEDDHMISFFKDHSQVFDGGFNRYIKQLQDSEPDKIEKLIDKPSYENDLKLDYSKLIGGLYIEALSEAISGNYGDNIEVCLLGASSGDIFKRSNEMWESEENYYDPIFKSIINGLIPCSALLNPKLKENALGRALKDIVTTPLIRNFIKNEYYSDDSSLSFSPLSFFEFVDGGEGHFSFEDMIDNSGLKYFFEQKFPTAYKIKRKFSFDFDDLDERRITFFFGARLDLEKFHHVLKLFMHGQRIFLDTNGLDQKLLDKLEAFYMENSLELERINYISPVTKAALGEGLIVTYNSEKLRGASLVKRSGFWDTMIDYLDVKHPSIQIDQGIFYYLKTRPSNTYELNYEEIRRFSFYNPTSYKKKAHIVSSQNFAFIRYIDMNRAEVNSTPIGIDIMLLPGGSVSLDFGFFEDN